MRFLKLPGSDLPDRQPTPPSGSTASEHPESHCLNCKAPLTDRYCPHCGQDSKEFKRSVFSISVQFFETFTDFDNKLWSSLGPLIFKPGFLTKQFLAGKRKSYLNPIQMYAFFSFIFFLTAFYYPDFNARANEDNLIQGIENSLYGADTSAKESYDSSRATISFGTGDSIHIERGKDNKIELDSGYRSIEEYDRVQASKPEAERHNFITRRLSKKLIGIVEKINRGEKGLVSSYFDVFKGNIPNLLILLLPIFALILKILYIRRKFYYVEHLIFAIHMHCFSFLLLSLNNVVSRSFSWGSEISAWLYLGLFIYFFLALKRMYTQGWLKTAIKYSMVVFLYSFSVGEGLLLNLVVSALLI